MDLDRIFRNRANRKIREARPFKGFLSSAEQCIDAAQAIIENRITSEHNILLTRSVIITTVTAIEIYCRDILDFIFKYCDPQFFEPKLKKLHQNKYDILDLIKVYCSEINPLEIIVNDISFQSAEKIEKVFSLFIEKSLWSEVLNLHLRIKDRPESETSFEPEQLEQLKDIFTLRHELVHNPGRKDFLNEDTLHALEGSMSMMFGVDVVLSQTLQQYKNPKLSNPYIT